MQSDHYFGMASAPEFHVYSCIPIRYIFIGVYLYLIGMETVQDEPL